MDENESDSCEIWDEFQWEKFLREQELSFEKYFRLLDHYESHPERDELVAKEMGWEELGTEEEMLDEWMADELSAMEEEDPEGTGGAFFESQVFRDFQNLFDLLGEAARKRKWLEDDPFFARLASSATSASGKAAAALYNQEDVPDLGMGIAYLKRGLNFINEALAAVSALQGNQNLPKDEISRIHAGLFAVRNRLVDAVGHFRAEWRRRYGVG